MEEQVIIVNRENEIINTVPRSVMRRDNLLHRASYIILENSIGEILVQQRSFKKDIYPGYYDPTTGGVVVAGESYEANAHRELEEELGISGVKPEFLFDFLFEDERSKVWGRAFLLPYDGEINPVDGEVTGWLFLKPNELKAFADQKQVMPDGMYVIERHFGQ